jgi:hypothetical protein
MYECSAAYWLSTEQFHRPSQLELLYISVLVLGQFIGDLVKITLDTSSNSEKKNPYQVSGFKRSANPTEAILPYMIFHKKASDKRKLHWKNLPPRRNAPICGTFEPRVFVGAWGDETLAKRDALLLEAPHHRAKFYTHVI